MKREEALCFLDEKVEVHEGVGGDVRPEDAALGIEDEGAVEGLVFEVIVRGIFLEDLLFGVGYEGEGDVAFGVIFLGVFEVGDVVGGDGEDGEVGFLEVGIAVGHGGELLGAMEAAGAEVEDEDEGFALVIGEGDGIAVLVGEGEDGGGGRGPVEGDEFIELGAGGEVVGRLMGLAPVGGVAEFDGDRGEAGEDRGVDFEVGREGAEVFEAGLPGGVLFFGMEEGVDGPGERKGFLVLLFDLFFGDFGGFFVITVSEVTKHG